MIQDELRRRRRRWLQLIHFKKKKKNHSHRQKTEKWYELRAKESKKNSKRNIWMNHEKPRKKIAKDSCVGSRIRIWTRIFALAYWKLESNFFLILFLACMEKGMIIIYCGEWKMSTALEPSMMMMWVFPVSRMIQKSKLYSDFQCV